VQPPQRRLSRRAQSKMDQLPWLWRESSSQLMTQMASILEQVKRSRSRERTTTSALANLLQHPAQLQLVHTEPTLMESMIMKMDKAVPFLTQARMRGLRRRPSKLRPSSRSSTTSAINLRRTRWT